jgi:ribonucleoside-diphosphate reductase alpha chain
VRGAVLEPEPNTRTGSRVADAKPSLPVVTVQPAQTTLKTTAAVALAPRSLEQSESGGVVYMTKPLDRPGDLEGRTYKVRWPELDHAFYITINDIEEGGRRRPFEIFINSKNMEHYAWTVALTRMVSAVFRRGGDVSFVVEELKAVFDPRGGQWMGGRYVPSLLAAIGEVIERHLISIGFMSRPEPAANDAERAAAAQAGAEGAQVRRCPRCQAAGFVRLEGCDTCTSCGYSRCS